MSPKTLFSFGTKLRENITNVFHIHPLIYTKDIHHGSTTAL